MVGATTRAGLLPGPLRDRFGFTGHLEFYDVAELDLIVHRSAGLLGVPTTPEGAAEIASRSRGTPRIANRLLRRVRDYAQVRADGTVTLEVAHAALDLYEVDELGLDRLDRAVLDVALPPVRRRAGRPLDARGRRRARSGRRSRRWPSRSWSGRASSPVRRGAGSPPRPPGSHLGLTPPDTRRSPRSSRSDATASVADAALARRPP